MDSIERLGPDKDVMGFFSKYMDKCKNLNSKERAVYCDFMKLITMERFVIDQDKINIEDLIHANRPGAIIRRRE